MHVWYSKSMCTHIPTYIFAFLKNLPAASSLPHIYIFLVNGNPMGLCSVCSRAGSSLLFVEVFVTKILLIHCEKIVDFCCMLLLIRKVYYCGFYMYSMCTIYKALVTPHTATNYDLKSCYISKKKSKRSDLVKGFFLKLALKLKCMNSNFL